MITLLARSKVSSLPVSAFPRTLPASLVTCSRTKSFSNKFSSFSANRVSSWKKKVFLDKTTAHEILKVNLGHRSFLTCWNKRVFLEKNNKKFSQQMRFGNLQYLS